MKGIDGLIDYNWRNFKELEPYNSDKVESCDSIDADFECGNLCKAFVKHEEKE